MIPQKVWSMLAYICVDDPILSDAGRRDIEEMVHGGITDETHIGAQIDTQGDFGSLRYEVSEPDFNGVSHRQVIERLPETFTGDPKTLSSFLAWGETRCEPNHRLLVLGGHGQGFRAPKRDVFWEQDQTGLLIPEIREVMQSLNFEADIVAFDACYMNLLEIACQFDGIAEVFISSQDVAPADGWDYEKVGTIMNTTPTVHEFSKRIVRHYYDTYPRDAYRTLSAIHIPVLGEVMTALDACGLALCELLESNPEQKSAIKKIRTKTQRFTLAMAECIDAGDFGNQLSAFSETYTSISKLGIELTRSVRRAVLANTRGRLRERSEGISIWFPDRGFIFNNGRPEYEQLSEKCPNWLRFLDEYHSLA